MHILCANIDEQRNSCSFSMIKITGEFPYLLTQVRWTAVLFFFPCSLSMCAYIHLYHKNVIAVCVILFIAVCVILFLLSFPFPVIKTWPQNQSILNWKETALKWTHCRMQWQWKEWKWACKTEGEGAEEGILIFFLFFLLPKSILIGNKLIFLRFFFAIVITGKWSPHLCLDP